MRLCLLFVCVGIHALLFGQNHPTNYSPLVFTPLDEGELEILKGAFEERANALELSGKDQKKRALEFAQGLSGELAVHNANGRLSTGDSLSQYLQRIVDRIVQANDLQKDYYRVYLLRSDVPNASNYGEGIIVFNLGLLAQMQTEAHTAFVLCHELAHDLEDHVFAGIGKKAEVLESEDFKKRIKEIEDLPYNQRAAIIQLRHEFLSMYNEHGRENELSADSIGFQLFKNAGYRLEAAPECIRLLDTADYLPPAGIEYASFYQFKQFPFQEKWMMEEKQINLGNNLDEYRLPDSLKTHPSCAKRDTALGYLLASFAGHSEKTPLHPGDHYYRMAMFEQLEWLKKNGNYGEMLYRALALSQRYPDNIYVKNSVGFALYGIYSAQYGHMYSRAVPMAGNSMQPEYARFLRFLHRLTLSTLKSHFVAYTDERLPESGIDDYSDMLHTLSACLAEEDPEERWILVQGYQEKYGENNHYLYLNKQFPEPNRKRKRK